MNLGELKPLLTALVLPPAGPLLLVLLGLAWAWPRKRLRTRAQGGPVLALLGVLLLWLLSCHAVALWLSRHALPQFAPLPAQPALALRQAGVQAIVVLGGGVRPLAREYGQPQPGQATEARLRYGLHLARAAQLPLGFAGGVGWGASGMAGHPPEAEVAQRYAEQAGLRIRWLDAQSRDTAENAERMAELLHAQGLKRIALVTHAWHMPRSLVHFERAGFEVLPAPMGYVEPRERPLLEWLPSGEGLNETRRVLREWLGLRLS
jgi:uncharacterized SAM-binding protein YcdF (DUF218 family)